MAIGDDDVVIQLWQSREDFIKPLTGHTNKTLGIWSKEDTSWRILQLSGVIRRVLGHSRAINLNKFWLGHDTFGESFARA
jgi:hypothetical protein